MFSTKNPSDFITQSVFAPKQQNQFAHSLKIVTKKPLADMVSRPKNHRPWFQKKLAAEENTDYFQELEEDIRAYPVYFINEKDALPTTPKENIYIKVTKEGFEYAVTTAAAIKGVIRFNAFYPELKYPFSPIDLLQLKPYLLKIISKRILKVEKQLDEIFVLKMGIREVVAQEILRAFNKYQPKTRFSFDEKTSEGFILSQGIENARLLNEIKKEQWIRKIKNKTYRGFGFAVFFALILKEIDLKLANIIVDKQGNIIKIDGEFCFANLIKDYKKNNYKINKRVIKNLPCLHTYYYAFNWLVEFGEGAVRKDKDLLSIRDLPDFMEEIWFSALQLLVFPNLLMRRLIKEHVKSLLPALDTFDEAIQSLYQHYVETETKDIYDTIVKSKEETLNAFHKNDEFLAYIIGDKAKNKLENYLNYAANLAVTGKNFLLKDEKEKTDFKKEVAHHYATLTKDVENYLQQPVPSRMTK